MNNDIIIYYGLLKLSELINQKTINLVETIDILNNSLAKLDVNDAKYIKKMNSIKEAILELNNDHSAMEKESFINRMFYIQSLFDISSLRKEI